MAADLDATINLDDITHIDFLEKTIGYLPKTISCRYNPGGEFKIANTIMDQPGNAKYGMTRPQMSEAFRILRDKGVEEFGIHSFLASNTLTNEYYPTLAAQLFSWRWSCIRAGRSHWFHQPLRRYWYSLSPDQEGNDINVIAEGVRKAYEAILVPAGMGDVAIFTELGRYMLAPYASSSPRLSTRSTHTRNILGWTPVPAI